MIEIYTEEAQERCKSLINSGVDSIWASIEQMPEDTDADRWKKKLKLIAKEYVFTSRFALMRIFLDRADPSQLFDETDPSRGFAVVLSDGTECSLEHITIEHAEQASEEEMLQFERLIMDQASRQSDFDAAKDAAIIQKALFPVQKKTTLLTRDEALQLGHILQFTLQEMQWFLLRVFDVEDGFLYNTSNDLIEAYGFLTEASNREVCAIKKKFKRLCSQGGKADFEEKDEGWTRDADDFLLKDVRSWSIYDRDDRDELFLKWLNERAPLLDLPSKTAVCVYRNLAVYAYNLAIQSETTPDVDTRRLRKDRQGKETDFVRCIREIVQMKGYADQTLEALFDNNTISPAKCEKVAGALLLENFNFSFSDQTDKTKAWHVVQVMTNGKMTVSGGINKSRMRVCDILSGKVERIEKSDMLYLLWFTSNLCWFDGKSWLSPKNIKDRLSDFIDACELCLGAAGLPKFYPPHLVEQSMMLSVVYAFGGPEKCDPAEIYEQLCSSVVERKAGKAGGESEENQSDGDKSEAPNQIASLRRQLKLNQTQLAESLGVTQTKISAWERGKSDPPEAYWNAMADLFGCSVDFLMGRTE